ncbi:MAG: sigma factor, partial [Planctomycetota bacterium]|nr:sigma factor [Planctomycetota bacterium]
MAELDRRGEAGDRRFAMAKNSPEPRSDPFLVEAANRGDPSAFAALYGRYRDWAFRLAYRFTGSREDALDVVQEVFIYLLR